MPKLEFIIDFSYSPERIRFSYAGYHQLTLTDGEGFYREGPEEVERERKGRALLSCTESELENKFKLGLGNGQGLSMAFAGHNTAEHFLSNPRFREIWKSEKTKIIFFIFHPKFEITKDITDGEIERGAGCLSFKVFDYSYCILEHPDYPDLYISRGSSLFSLRK